MRLRSEILHSPGTSVLAHDLHHVSVRQVAVKRAGEPTVHDRVERNGEAELCVARRGTRAGVLIPDVYGGDASGVRETAIHISSGRTWIRGPAHRRRRGGGAWRL